MAWVEIYESHTHYEWRVQKALSIVDPWGDDRADQRAYVNTLAALDPSEESLESARQCGLKINEHEEEAGPAQIRALLES